MGMENLSERRGRLATWVVLASLGLGVGCTGGGESIISGMGNSGNRIGTAALWDSLANELAEHTAIPAVSDDEIERVYTVIRGHALEGNIEAALVLLKLAEEQREDD